MQGFHTKDVVVPIDFSSDSHEAIDSALKFFSDESNIHVLHVAADLMAVEPGIIWEEMSDETRRKNLTEEFNKEYADSGHGQLKFHVAFGDAGHEIADFAEKLGAGIIVMPSHGRTGFSRVLIGSVAERVVRLAHCPVLVLKKAR